jgi:hypothetical protein
MNVFDYLFYKLYRATLLGSLKDIAVFAATCYFSLLIFLNIFVVGAFLRKIDVIPVFLYGKVQLAILICIVIAINYFIFVHSGRYKQIIMDYEQEVESRRKKGNLIVWLYVLGSFLMIFAVAFYKPGQL